MACLFAFETSSPSGFFSKIATSFALPFFAISLSLNILLTLMIVFRLAAYRQKGRDIFGKAYGQHYGSISTMFIESAALYTICSILLLVTYAIGHPINQIWLGISPAVQVKLTLHLPVNVLSDGCQLGNIKLFNYLSSCGRSCLEHSHSRNRSGAFGHGLRLWNIS